MVIEANFHPHSALELDKLRGLGDRVVEVHSPQPGKSGRGRGAGVELGADEGGELGRERDPG